MVQVAEDRQILGSNMPPSELRVIALLDNSLVSWGGSNGQGERGGEVVRLRQLGLRRCAEEVLC